ncbi:MAG: enoyl-CoA hydratase/isomerase family protein [Vulcanimicrobiaceae bacterium]
MNELVRVEREAQHPGVWRLLLDDREHANALGPTMVSALQNAFDSARASEAHAIVITSTGDHFSGGFDLRGIDGAVDADLRERFVAIEILLDTIRSCPAVTIACVRGAAIGAGADVVAACDYRLGTHDVRMAFPGAGFGIILGTRHLIGLIGAQSAREIVIEGRVLDSESALACGLLSEVHDAASLDSRVEQILTSIEAIDLEALRAVLRLTRSYAVDSALAELVRSTLRPGLAERMRKHSRATRAKKSTPP